MPASLSLLVSLSLGQASAEPTAAWVQRTVAQQRRASAAPSDGGATPVLSSARPALQGFVPPTSLAPLVRAVRASVVGLTARNEGTSRSLGSGFVVTADGLVVTNAHVVRRASAITAHLASGERVPCAVVGLDATTDLAVLRLEGGAPVTPATLGDSDALAVGDWVVAIGSPFGFEASVTHGLVSAQARTLGLGPYDDFIQTNALINPGNSGGPLFDMKGEVVGVTTAVMSQGQGVSFAIPSSLVRALLPNLVDNGHAERGWLGLSVEESTARNGAVVQEVYAESPAAAAGLQPGDRIVSIDGRDVDDYRAALKRIALQRPGTSVKLGVVREGRRRTAVAVLAQRPAR